MREFWFLLQPLYVQGLNVEFFCHLGIKSHFFFEMIWVGLTCIVVAVHSRIRWRSANKYCARQSRVTQVLMALKGQSRVSRVSRLHQLTIFDCLTLTVFTF